MSIFEIYKLKLVSHIEFYPHNIVVGLSTMDANTLDLETQKYICVVYWNSKPYCIQLEKASDLLIIHQLTINKELQWPVVLRITRLSPSKAIEELKHGE